MIEVISLCPRKFLCRSSIKISCLIWSANRFLPVSISCVFLDLINCWSFRWISIAMHRVKEAFFPSQKQPSSSLRFPLAPYFPLHSKSQLTVEHIECERQGRTLIFARKSFGWLMIYILPCLTFPLWCEDDHSILLRKRRLSIIVS